MWELEQEQSQDLEFLSVNKVQGENTVLRMNRKRKKREIERSNQLPT